jgi:hypothetical protein
LIVCETAGKARLAAVTVRSTPALTEADPPIRNFALSLVIFPGEERR